MKDITITDNEGNQYSGQIPESWHEVPLANWLLFDKLKAGKPDGMEPVLLVSSLTTLPDTILNDDVSLVPLLLHQMPWVATMPMPASLQEFMHQGITYEHVNNLEKVNMGQLEGLLNSLHKTEQNALQATPMLLAILYKPKGKVQDIATVNATAEALRSVPVTYAWSAITSLLTNSTALASQLHVYSQTQEKLLHTLSAIERVLQVAPSGKRSSRIMTWWGLRYIRSVKKALSKVGLPTRV